jgi:hypothetical protein
LVGRQCATSSVSGLKVRNLTGKWLAYRFRQNRNTVYVFVRFRVPFGFYLFVSFTRRPLAGWPATADKTLRLP